MFVYAPALILEGSVGQIIIAAVSALIRVFAIAVALEGFIKKPVAMISRIILFISALMLFHPEMISSLVGLTSLRKKSPTSKREGAPAPVKVGDEFRLGTA